MPAGVRLKKKIYLEKIDGLDKIRVMKLPNSYVKDIKMLFYSLFLQDLHFVDLIKFVGALYLRFTGCASSTCAWRAESRIARVGRFYGHTVSHTI
jgi:hypothetical protein